MEVEMNKPNLFKYATSELSQDAFLCWLLAWADNSQKENDPSLHEVGVDCINALFLAAGETRLQPGFAVIPHRQIENIDVAVEIGKEHILIIEDKTYTTEHSNQLERYAKIAKDKWPGHEIVHVFLKTGDQSSYSEIKKKGWVVFARKELLELLRSKRQKITNHIYLDFLEHIEEMENAIQSWSREPVACWGNNSPIWQGFYIELQKHFDADWGYVANPSGGFTGFWWGWCKCEECRIYLQLEENKLVIKVNPLDKARRAQIRDYWVQKICATDNPICFERPSRLGNGEYMTVAIKSEYLQIGKDGLINLEATIDFLQQATNQVKELSEKFGFSQVT
jgi:hypothetical protein